MNIISLPSETPGITREEINRFLKSKLMLQMATIDEQSEPKYSLCGFTMKKIEKNFW
jgi:hypothetical protein